MKKILISLLSAALLLCPVALAEEVTPVTWLGYELTPALVTSGQQVTNLSNSFRSQNSLTGALVLVRLTPAEGKIVLADIQGRTSDFTLTAADGTAFTTTTISLPDIIYDGGISFAEEQTYIELVFILDGLEEAGEDAFTLTLAPEGEEAQIVTLLPAADE